MKPVYLSKEGLEKLKEELNELKTVRRPETITRLEKAKDLGDLRENADYHDSKEELGRIEGRILELEGAIINAVIIEAKESDSVCLGCTVTVKTKDGKLKDFAVVGRTEADPLLGRISNESPIGKALLGKKVGETAEVETPAGKMEYTISEIHC